MSPPPSLLVEPGFDRLTCWPSPVPAVRRPAPSPVLVAALVLAGVVLLLWAGGGVIGALLVAARIIGRMLLGLVALAGALFWVATALQRTARTAVTVGPDEVEVRRFVGGLPVRRASFGLRELERVEVEERDGVAQLVLAHGGRAVRVGARESEAVWLAGLIARLADEARRQPEVGEAPPALRALIERARR